VFTDVKDIVFDSTVRYDESFFVHLARIVRSGWLDRRDDIMIDHLRSLGIAYGKPFSPDEATRQALAAGIRAAHAWLESKYDAGLEPFFYDTHWSFPVPSELIPPAPELIPLALTTSSDWPSYPIDARGFASHYAYLGTLGLGAGQFCLINIKDK